MTEQKASYLTGVHIASCVLMRVPVFSFLLTVMVSILIAHIWPKLLAKEHTQNPFVCRTLKHLALHNRMLKILELNQTRLMLSGSGTASRKQYVELKTCTVSQSEKIYTTSPLSHW